MYKPKCSILIIQITCVVNLIRKYIIILPVNFLNIDMNGRKLLVFCSFISGHSEVKAD